jgi:DNA-binding MarR family transcriptional regulator
MKPSARELPVPPLLDEQFCFPLYAAANLVTRAYGPALAPLGLTYPQYLVMLVLLESAPLTVRSLGKRLLLESGTLSPLLRRLEARKLLLKHVDPADARRVIVTLTSKGQAMAGDLAQVQQTVVCALLARGGERTGREMLALRDQLKRLLAGWTEDDSTEDPPPAEPKDAR